MSPRIEHGNQVGPEAGLHFDISLSGEYWAGSSVTGCDKKRLFQRVCCMCCIHDFFWGARDAFSRVLLMSPTSCTTCAPAPTASAGDGRRIHHGFERRFSVYRKEDRFCAASLSEEKKAGFYCKTGLKKIKNDASSY